MRLFEALQDYQSFQEARGDSLAHRKECIRMLTALSRDLDDVELSEIVAEDLRQFLSRVRQRRGLKARERVSDLTVFAYHRTLNAFFNYLFEQQRLVRNPMKGVPKPRVGEYLIRPFSEEQVRKLLAQPDPETFTGLRDITLMCFLLDTGCRISEALSLTFEDLDLGRRLARVLGKGKKERLVPFGDCARAWLESYLDRRRQDDTTSWVYVNQYGGKLTANAMTHRIAAHGRRAGLRGVRVSPHTFRHTFSVNWLIGAADFKGDALSLQKILGHSTPAMTQRYVHLVGQDLRRLHERLSPTDRLAESPPVSRRRRLR